MPNVVSLVARTLVAGPCDTRPSVSNTFRTSGGAIDRHRQCAARLAVTENRVRSRVARVSQIERDVSVVETAGRHHDFSTLGSHLGDVLRSHVVEEVRFSTEESHGRGRIIRGDEPDHPVRVGPAPIIRAVRLQYDSGAAIPGREAESSATDRCARESALPQRCAATPA